MSLLSNWLLSPKKLHNTVFLKQTSGFFGRFFVSAITKMMQDTDPLYQHVREVMVEVMAVLYTHGQKTLHVGAMMRLLGVEEQTACLHDEDRIDIEENFDELAKSIHMKYIQSTAPAGATIH